MPKREMPTIIVSTDVRAPRERVFDLARDVEVHTRSLARTRETVVSAPRRLLEAGDEVTWRGRHFGRWWTHTARITAFDPPHFFRDEMIAGAFARFRHDHSFDERGGGTTVVDTVEFASPVGRVVDALVLKPYLERLLRGRARHLKELAE